MKTVIISEELPSLPYAGDWAETRYQVIVPWEQELIPLKTNMEPENDGSQRNLLFQGFMFGFQPLVFAGCTELFVLCSSF